MMASESKKTTTSDDSETWKLKVADQQREIERLKDMVRFWQLEASGCREHLQPVPIDQLPGELHEKVTVEALRGTEVISHNELLLYIDGVPANVSTLLALPEDVRPSYFSRFLRANTFDHMTLKDISTDLDAYVQKHDLEPWAKSVTALAMTIGQWYFPLRSLLPANDPLLDRLIGQTLGAISTDYENLEFLDLQIRFDKQHESRRRRIGAHFPPPDTGNLIDGFTAKQIIDHLRIPNAIEASKKLKHVTVSAYFRLYGPEGESWYNGAQDAQENWSRQMVTEIEQLLKSKGNGAVVEPGDCTYVYWRNGAGPGHEFDRRYDPGETALVRNIMDKSQPENAAT